MPSVISPDSWERMKQEGKSRFALTEDEKRSLTKKQFEVGKKRGEGMFEVLENGKVTGVTSNMGEAERLKHLSEQNR